MENSYKDYLTVQIILQRVGTRLRNLLEHNILLIEIHYRIPLSGKLINDTIEKIFPIIARNFKREYFYSKNTFIFTSCTYKLLIYKSCPCMKDINVNSITADSIIFVYDGKMQSRAIDTLEAYGIFGEIPGNVFA